MQAGGRWRVQVDHPFRRPASRAHRGPDLWRSYAGGAHLANFGVFASPERTLLFDLNDFDETLPGLSKLAEKVDGGYRIVSQPPVVVPARELTASAGMCDVCFEAVPRCGASTTGTGMPTILWQWAEAETVREPSGCETRTGFQIYRTAAERT